MRLGTLPAAVAAGFLSTNSASAYLQTGCANQQYSAAQISQAIQNSPYASQALKSSSCTFGGAGIAESGGNTCESNGNNFGVLQLTSSNLPPGTSANQYLNSSLQTQVDTWAKQVGNSNTSGAYQTLANNGQVGGYNVTPGTLAACFQFGPLICKNDVAALQSGGACPTSGNGGVVATGATLRNGTANLDGNGQSICSWGKSIQNKINQAASTCQNGGGTTTPTNNGGTNCPGSGANPGGVISPSPGNAPVSLPSSVA